MAPNEEDGPDAGLVTVIPLTNDASVKAFAKLTSAIPSPPNIGMAKPCVAISSAM